MTKKRKTDISIGQKIIIVLLSFSLLSFLVLIRKVNDYSNIKKSEVTVYDQNLEKWTPSNENGVLLLEAVNTASPKDIESISPDNVYTAECNYIDQKPETVTLTCADGGIQVHNIVWDIWNASGARGKGIYYYDCEPDCVSGKYFEAQVEVRLSRLMTDGTRFYLTSFNAYSLDGKVLDMGWTFPWEFEEIILNEDGSISTAFLD